MNRVYVRFMTITIDGLLIGMTGDMILLNLFKKNFSVRSIMTGNNSS